MKDLVGQDVFIHVAGKTISGKLIENQKDRVLVRGNNDIVWRVIKSHIAMFRPQEKERTSPATQPEQSSGIHVWGCVDKVSGGNVGFYYLTDKKLEPGEFEQNCGIEPGKYAIIDAGDLFSLDREKLAEILNNMIIGDIPEEDE